MLLQNALNGPGEYRSFVLCIVTILFCFFPKFQ